MKIGIIGGSGLDNPDILINPVENNVDTIYGKPSSPLKTGTIEGVEVAIIARHGYQHTITPSTVNNRANIQALKNIGCTHILATTAVGSLRKDIERGDLVIIDQFIDFTRHRTITFHDEFKPTHAAHTPMAAPFNEKLRALLIESCNELQLKHHKKGTVVTIEGPRFSTKAESKMFRTWGADIINMSTAPESILANEASIPYAAIAMSTDYDCLFDDVPAVTWDEIVKVFAENADKVLKLLTRSIKKMHLPSIVKNNIRTIPNWPKPGIMFKDITTLLNNAEGFQATIQLLSNRYQDQKIQKIIGIESRGFIIGAALAHTLNLPFIPIRKPGKLPAETIEVEYKLEYGKDKVQIHKDAIQPGEKCLIVDDLIATGGTCLAAVQLVKQLGGEVIECSFIVDLPDIGGSRKLTEQNIPWSAIVQFEGD